MKHIKLFENFVDEILDKINKFGINSLNELEKEYLKANSEENNKEMEKLEREAGKREFISSNKLFSFELSRAEHFGDESFYYGTIHVPDISHEEYKVSGDVEGVIEYRDGTILPNFQKEQYGLNWDIDEFIEGLEHEFFQFLQYIIDDLEEE